MPSKPILTKNGPTYKYTSPSSDSLNPYRTLDPENDMSWFNNITDSLGLTKKRQSLSQEYDLMASEWDSQRALALEDREYNSESAQVARQRAAGLNPDLLGVQAGSSDQAGSVPDSLKPEQGLSGSSPQEFTSFISSIGDALFKGFSLVNGLTMMNLDVASKELDNFNKMFDPSMSSIAGDYATALLGKANDSDKPFDALFKDSFSLVGPDFDRLFGGFKSKRVERYARQRYNNYINGEEFRQRVYDHFNKSSKSAADSARSYSEYKAITGNEDMFSVMSNVYDAIENSKYFKALGNLEYDKLFNYGLSARSQNAQNKYASDYYSNRSGSAAAHLDNVTTQNQTNAAELDGFFNQMLNDTMKSLDKSISDPKVSSTAKFFAKFLKISILVGRLGVNTALNNVPTIVGAFKPAPVHNSTKIYR